MARNRNWLGLAGYKNGPGLTEYTGKCREWARGEVDAIRAAKGLTQMTWPEGEDVTIRYCVPCLQDKSKVQATHIFDGAGYCFPCAREMKAQGHAIFSVSEWARMELQESRRRKPGARKYVKVTHEMRREIIAHPEIPATKMAARFGISSQTVHNVWAASRERMEDAVKDLDVPRVDEGALAASIAEQGPEAVEEAVEVVPEPEEMYCTEPISELDDLLKKNGFDPQEVNRRVDEAMQMFDEYNRRQGAVEVPAETIERAREAGVGRVPGATYCCPPPAAPEPPAASDVEPAVSPVASSEHLPCRRCGNQSDIARMFDPTLCAPCYNTRGVWQDEPMSPLEKTIAAIDGLNAANYKALAQKFVAAADVMDAYEGKDLKSPRQILMEGAEPAVVSITLDLTHEKANAIWGGLSLEEKATFCRTKIIERLEMMS